MDQPRAVTAGELRDHFMDTCRALADFWAGELSEPHTCHERIQGALHSFLCILDGSNGGLPAFTVAADPHPDDKRFRIGEGENWIEPGTVINGDVLLHELLYNRGAWHRVTA